MKISKNFNPFQRAFPVKTYLETKSFKITRLHYAKQFYISLKNKSTAVDVPCKLSIYGWLQSFKSVVWQKICENVQIWAKPAVGGQNPKQHQ